MPDKNKYLNVESDFGVKEDISVAQPHLDKNKYLSIFEEPIIQQTPNIQPEYKIPSYYKPDYKPTQEEVKATIYGGEPKQHVKPDLSKGLGYKYSEQEVELTPEEQQKGAEKTEQTIYQSQIS